MRKRRNMKGVSASSVYVSYLIELSWLVSVNDATERINQVPNELTYIIGIFTYYEFNVIFTAARAAPAANHCHVMEPYRALILQLSQSRGS